jgi:hypothetical protein
MHSSTILEKNAFKQGTNNMSKPGRRRAATSHAPRPRASWPRRLHPAPPETARRPRLAPPHVPRPEAPRSPPGPCARHGPRRTGTVRAADCQFVGGARRPRPPCHRIFAVTPLSLRSSRPYLSPMPCPSSRRHRRLPRHPCRHR